MIFKIFSQKNFVKKLAGFVQNKATLCENCIITLVFEKNANFFAENWQKSQKIVIITSAPVRELEKAAYLLFYILRKRATSGRDLQVLDQSFVSEPGSVEDPVIRTQGCQIFEPKIPIWVNFGRSCNVNSWYILWPLGIFYSYLVYFMVDWYIFW
jgi:hypothetical protein